MSPLYPRIRFHASHGALLIRDGLKICFYMRRSLQELAPAIWRCLETFLRAAGPQSFSWYWDHEGDWGQLDTMSWHAFQRDLLESTWSHHELLDEPSGAPAFRFEYFGKRLDDPQVLTEPAMVSSLSFWLPTEFMEEQGSSKVRELALQLAALLPFNSGHAGLCFNAHLGYSETEHELSRLCLRYPGMDIVDVESLSLLLGAQVKGPSWLTFLGQPVLGQLGGIEALRSRLSSPGTTVQPLEGERAVISLGPWPEAGDTQAGQLLPEYRELARVLEPHLFHSPKPGSADFPEDIWRRWERRFLD